MDVSTDMKIILNGRNALNYKKVLKVLSCALNRFVLPLSLLPTDLYKYGATGFIFSNFTVFYFCFIFLRQSFLPDT